MPKCAVKSCPNNTLRALKKDGISYFRFPKNEIEREKWRKIIAEERCEECFKPNDSSVVCSDHFAESDMFLTKANMRKIIRKALPKIQPIEYALPPHYMQPEIKPEIVQIKKEDTAVSNPDDILYIYDPRSPSPASSEINTPIESPKSAYYEKTIIIYQKELDLKTKEVKNLIKKNQRLVEMNQILKRTVVDLKKKLMKGGRHTQSPCEEVLPTKNEGNRTHDLRILIRAAEALLPVNGHEQKV